MANPSTAHEPSMEEILASIRQIISEDGDGSSAPKAESAHIEAVASPPAEAEAEREPYATVVSRFESEPEPTIEPQPINREIARPQTSARPPQPAAENYGAPAQLHPVLVRRPVEKDEDSPLLSPEKGAAVTGAFGALAHTILAQNSRTLEEVVAGMLQPMLKSWLDDNLPSLVERMVQEEIERVSRGRR
jgi:cell pole-organizing protein PopZ